MTFLCPLIIEVVEDCLDEAYEHVKDMLNREMQRRDTEIKGYKLPPLRSVKQTGEFPTMPFEYDTDHAILMIDNNKHALAHVLKVVRQHVDKGERQVAKELQEFCWGGNLWKVFWAATKDKMSVEWREANAFWVAILKHSDLHEQADYWLDFARHYIQQHNEGNWMVEYLLPNVNFHGPVKPH
jgi:hypothetical protein